jgi:hypothetical protein
MGENQEYAAQPRLLKRAFGENVCGSIIVKKISSTVILSTMW